MKKIVSLFISILCIFTICSYTIVRADEVGISEINIYADTPSGFDRDINILLEFEDMNTGLFTLKLGNGYRVESVIQTGVAKVKQVDILGNVGQYEIVFPDEILVEKDVIANMQLLIKDVELENLGESIDDIEQSDYSINESKDNKIEKAEEVEGEYNKQDRGESGVKNRLIKNFLSTAIILIIVLAIYLIVKHKKES